ncbi:DNA cytosine methyltransferase [Pedobacter sp. MC2016-05]|uniref:DNA cytosine methyltransferase n=1 Tax=Pedobacter sp. MC2016-05 TaxID=2994474 RepID=UPI00224705D2|nr:DNA cytosine methyltransferase [Pedobacter sp. MC2016-05]MCX2476096.1 DNA cytosine methyltransferase [Pedobacter sp. MC2016-05]
MPTQKSTLITNTLSPKYSKNNAGKLDNPSVEQKIAIKEKGTQANLSLEDSLFELASPFTPEGTQTKSVLQQWVHALASGRELFAAERGANKQNIIKALKTGGHYKNEKSFRDEVYSKIHLKPTQDNKMDFSFIDLFAGIGGMRQGFERAGGICVFSSEFEKNAQFTYEANFGEHPFGDITKIDPSDIPAHDVLVGGFPCQPFSHAGKKLGIEDTRGTLFHNIAMIIQAKKPKAVVLENVRGLISHDKGYTLKVVLGTLIDEGYKCNIPEDIIRGAEVKKLQNYAKKMVMRSREFGVPQNRQRIYIVLWREDLEVNFTYPEPPNRPTRVGQILEPEVSSEFTISDRLWEGHRNRKLKNEREGKGFGYSVFTDDSPYTNTISARYYKDGSEVLINQHGMNPRKITPREAARLQGFPDNFILHPSKVQAYKQFGNSVTIPVVHAVAKNIYQQIIEPNAK